MTVIEEVGEDVVRVELEIIQGQLKQAGVRIPISEMEKWTILDRAEAEQWAVRKNQVPEVIKQFLKQE
jgi:hypothetical protein